jgi:hypothetical protein
VSDLYSPRYIEVDHYLLMNHVERMVTEEVTKAHRLTELVRMGDGRWLLKFAPDVLKQVQIKGKE